MDVYRILKRLPVVRSFVDRLDRIERKLDMLCDEQGGSRNLGNLEMLPGTRHSIYALPLDYLPSLDLTPRWGYLRPPIQILDSWFADHTRQYLEMIEYMRSLRVDHIPHTLGGRVQMPQPAWIGGAICSFDALALYAMLCKYRPKCYLEIGSGMTTCFARQAVTDAKLSTRIVSIEPKPRNEIDGICDFAVRDALEACDMTIFDALQPGDVLFFDGTHRVFMNSDVTVFFLDILPRLKPGVIVHLHDIFLPYDYPENFKYWYWSEQYILAAWMIASRDKINPLFPTCYVCTDGQFREAMRAPFVDLGSANANSSWKSGGSMWFTHQSS